MQTDRAWGKYPGWTASLPSDERIQAVSIILAYPTIDTLAHSLLTAPNTPKAPKKEDGWDDLRQVAQQHNSATEPTATEMLKKQIKAHSKKIQPLVK